MDHKAELKLLVLEKVGKSAADAIDWSSPRLVCIAADFTKYDSHAVQQMDRNIELLRYRQFGKELLLLELVNATGPSGSGGGKPKPRNQGGTSRTAGQMLKQLPPHLKEVFRLLEDNINTMGDDVQRKDLKRYVAFKRLRNFLTACFHRNSLLLYLHLDPKRVQLVDGFTRDVRGIGHWGTGQLEVTLKNREDLEKALPLVHLAYNGGTPED
jgi:predicted transport protein